MTIDYAGHKAAPGQGRRGRGLFARMSIAKNEVIARACSVPIDAEQCLKLDRMQPLGDFYFAHPLDDKLGLMVLGMPSLCNHADPANADVTWHKDEEIGWIATLVALVDIRAGEEITYRYRCEIWFDQT